MQFIFGALEIQSSPQTAIYCLQSPSLCVRVCLMSVFAHMEPYGCGTKKNRKKYEHTNEFYTVIVFITKLQLQIYLGNVEKKEAHCMFNGEI